MRIRTKLTALVAGVLLISFTICGFFSINQFINTSIERLAKSEAEKMAVSKWALEEVTPKEDLEQMLELARDAYLKYQFSRCYQNGYALIKNQVCVSNLTDYEIINTTSLPDEYCIQKVNTRWLLLMKSDLDYPQGFQVLAVKDITDAWTDARRQVLQYLAMFACTFAASMLVLTWLIRQMLGVLEQLERQADAISRGDFSRKTQVHTKDELAQLSQSINRMSDKIEQQIEDLQLLLGAMAHETKTPVTSIMGYADSLLHVRLKESQKEQALEAIYRSAGRLDKLSGKLLQLIGLYENQELQMEPLQIAEILRNSCSQIQGTLADTQIHIVLEHVTDFTVTGDRLLLGVLFDNLLSNAVKSFDGPGTIHIQTSRENRSVSILDHGHGISSQDFPHVRKAFYMADKSRSRRQQGAGLGLALADRIVQAHHADMNIESELGKGTCVTITFPPQS